MILGSILFRNLRTSPLTDEYVQVIIESRCGEKGQPLVVTTFDRVDPLTKGVQGCEPHGPVLESAFTEQDDSILTSSDDLGHIYVHILGLGFSIETPHDRAVIISDRYRSPSGTFICTWIIRSHEIPAVFLKLAHGFILQDTAECVRSYESDKGIIPGNAIAWRA